MKPKRSRDIESGCSAVRFAARLRRLADAIEKGGRFEVRVAGERIYVPSDAEFSIEHERDRKGEEIEFQIKWKRG